MSKIKPSEVTPESVYLTRRQFLIGAGAVLAGATVLSACDQSGLLGPTGKKNAKAPITGKSADELGGKLTPFEAVTGYNNFYEFSLDKEEVASVAGDFKARPWTIRVGGLVQRPRTFDIDDVIRRFGAEERIYRHRCVEGWSMVIPWLGFSLRKLLAEVGPLAKAKYVQFTTLYDPERMPGQKAYYGYPWPYVEGLRLDEALHDLTLLSHGLYGRALLPQNGAPLRLVVPWKYGFKAIKSIVGIDLVEKAPVSLWMKTAPGEYGFYANVNPAVAHPRWPQSSERRIGEAQRRRTLPFNGYAEQVAGLYRNMNLRKFY